MEDFETFFNPFSLFIILSKQNINHKYFFLSPPKALSQTRWRILLHFPSLHSKPTLTFPSPQSPSLPSPPNFQTKSKGTITDVSKTIYTETSE
jgi:hypothetical protein